MRHAAVIALALISLAAPSEARGAAGHVVLMRHLENPQAYAGRIDVTSDAGGSVLIDSAGGQRSRVQARDPVSGALIRQSPVYEGVSRPYLGGIAGGGLWIGASGGMMGYVERLSLRTLRPVAFAGAQPHPGISAPPAIFGTNGVRAQLMAGILWVSQINAGPTRNYCGSPVSGRSLAAAVPHMGAHAIGAAAYASPAIRAALQQLPPAGENRSGPLGPGLLASGLLGTIIGDLQIGLAEPGQPTVPF